eukprot:scaffold870_cov393-Prasinococcus_capsulatus_cf.AAC.17
MEPFVPSPRGIGWLAGLRSARPPRPAAWRGARRAHLRWPDVRDPRAGWPASWRPEEPPAHARATFARRAGRRRRACGAPRRGRSRSRRR